jgi:DtxR family Mn-dependent transcriptional regulator
VATVAKATRARSFSPAVEDYLKAIYRLESEAGEPVTTNALCGWLGVTAPSASGMLKKQDDLRLVAYVPYRGVHLSEAGRRMALAVIRRHRLLEAFLAETLGLSWDKVHDEAVVEAPSESLGSLGPGQRGRVARVSDRDERILRFLSERGIALGDVLEVRHVRLGGAVTVQARSGVHLLDAAVAAAMKVEAAR